ncbi:MAG TPA: DUF4358 domain-containing protein [Clostridiales bacterium]|jgi:hypothetical protein|nr:DUF4358 domain-containing protein [Clostridiales bacterium]
MKGFEMMNFKKIAALLLCIVLAAAMISCGGKPNGGDSAPVELDVKKTAESITSATAFSGEMIELPDDYIALNYSIADTEKIAVWSSGAATAEQVIVIKTKSGATDKAKSSLDSWLSDQAAIYDDYAPDQAVLLRSATIKTAGGYIIAVVSADTAGAGAAIDAAINPSAAETAAAE